MHLVRCALSLSQSYHIKQSPQPIQTHTHTHITHITHIQPPDEAGRRTGQRAGAARAWKASPPHTQGDSFECAIAWSATAVACVRECMCALGRAETTRPKGAGRQGDTHTHTHSLSLSLTLSLTRGARAQKFARKQAMCASDRLRRSWSSGLPVFAVCSSVGTATDMTHAMLSCSCKAEWCRSTA